MCAQLFPTSSCSERHQSSSVQTSKIYCTVHFVTGACCCRSGFSSAKQTTFSNYGNHPASYSQVAEGCLSKKSGRGVEVTGSECLELYLCFPYTCIPRGNLTNSLERREVLEKLAVPHQSKNFPHFMGPEGVLACCIQRAVYRSPEPDNCNA